MQHIISGAWAARWGNEALLFLRVATGLIFFTHGWQKWQAGPELTAAFLNTLQFPLPEVLAILLIGIEVFGGLALIFGVYTRFAATITGLDAIVAILVVHASKGYSATTGGYEYVLLLVAACALLLVMGGGTWSVDKKVLKM